MEAGLTSAPSSPTGSTHEHAGFGADPSPAIGPSAALDTIKAASSGSVCVFPACVEFHNVLPGTTYSTLVRVQNAASKTQRIRVVPPASKNFKVAYSHLAPVAPGLECVCEVIYSTPVAGAPGHAAGPGSTGGVSKHDGRDCDAAEIVIRAETGTLRVPVRAFPPLPILRMDEHINIGDVILGSSAARYFDVANLSLDAPAEVMTTYRPDAPVYVIPARLPLPAGANGRLRVEFRSEGMALGPWSGEIAVSSPGLAPKTVRVSARVVSQDIAFLDADTGLPLDTNVDFPHLFYGQTTSRNVIVANNGPSPIRFFLNMTDGTAPIASPAAGTRTAGDKSGGTLSTNLDSGYSTPGGVRTAGGRRTASSPSRGGGSRLGGSDDADDDGSAPSAPAALPNAHFRVTPREGMLGPYERVQVKILFEPRDEFLPPGFRTQAAQAEAAGPDAWMSTADTQFAADRAASALGPSRAGASVLGAGARTVVSDAASAHAPSTRPIIPLPSSTSRIHGRYYDVDGDLANVSAPGSSSASRRGSRDGTQLANTASDAALSLTSGPSQAALAHSARGLRPEQKAKAAALKGKSAYQLALETSTPAPLLQPLHGRLVLTVPDLATERGVWVGGYAERAVVHASTHAIDFAGTPVTGRKDAILMVTSRTHSLPVTVRCGKVANVYVEPSVARLEPGQSAEFIVSYMPTRLGTLEDVLPLLVAPANGFAMAPKQHAMENAFKSQLAARGGSAQSGPGATAPLSQIPLAQRVTDPAGAMEKLVAEMPGVLVALPLSVTGKATVVQLPGRSPLRHGDGSDTLGLAHEENKKEGDESVEAAIAAAAAAVADEASRPPTSPQAFRRSDRFRSRSAHAPPTMYDPGYTFVDRGGAERASSPPSSAMVSRSAKLPPWAVVAATRGLSEHDVPTQKKYTYTIGDLRAQQMHKTAYVQFIRQSALQRKVAHAIADTMRASGVRALDELPPFVRAMRSGKLDTAALQQQLASKQGSVQQMLQGVKWDDSTSLGLEDPKSALAPPRLVMPPADEPLWMARPLGIDGRPVARPGGTRHKHNPDKLIRQKFKSAPSTQAEAVDCTLQLSDEQLQCVSAGPSHIDFGTVNVRTQVVKSFSVVNDLAHAIHVEVRLPEDISELNQSKPLAQVIPAGAIAGFDLAFYTNDEQELRTDIHYVINGQHTSKFTVTARAMPVSLVPSKRDVLLRFADDSLEAAVSETISLRNPGTAIAEYTWVPLTANASAFSLEPISGVVQPGEQASTVITFQPLQHSAVEAAFLLRVVGGPAGEAATVLNVVGEEQDPRFVLTEKKLDFGKLGVGLKREMTVGVRNEGTTAGVFYVAGGLLPPKVTVHPMVGRVDPGETLDITVRFVSDAPMTLEPASHCITLNARGGSVVTLPVAATVIMPDVFVTERTIDFGEVTVGNVVRRRMTLINRSPIHTEVAVDFTHLPCFFVAPPQTGDRDDMSVGDESMFQVESIGDASEDRGFRAAGRLGSRASAKIAPADDGGDSDEEEDGDEGGDPFANIPRKFRVKLQPDGTLPFDLVFRPTDTSQHAFELPLTVPGLTDVPGLRRRVSGKGVLPRIALDPGPVVDFEFRVIMTDASRRIPYSRNFRMRNLDTQNAVHWRADTSNLRPCFGGARAVFTMEPECGAIPVDGAATIKVTFNPDAAKDYTNTVPLFLLDSAPQAPGAAGAESATPPAGVSRGSRPGSRLSRGSLEPWVGVQPYMDLELRGTGIQPQLSFDVREVVLPVVPLGVESKATFFVVCNGYDHLELKHRVVGGTLGKDGPTVMALPITCAFPEGSVVSLSKSRLPVHISFKSDKPVAFTASIEFSDDGGRTFSIPVSGAADASILSTYSYMENMARSICYTTAQGAPVKLAPAPGSAGYVAEARPPASSAGSTAAEASAGAKTKSVGAVPSRRSSTVPVLPAFEAHAAGPTAGGRATTGAAATRSIRGPAAPVLSQAATAVLVRWLNACVLRGPIQRFPEDIVAQHGKPILDALESLSGKSIPGRIRGRVPAGKKERALTLYTQARDVLTWMKSLGAVLPHVRPEALLNKEDFARYRKYQHKGAFGAPWGAPVLEYFSPTARVARRKLLSAVYGSLSVEAWTAVVLQAVKVFVLPRITVKSLMDLPGMVLSRDAGVYLRYLHLRESMLTDALNVINADRRVTPGDAAAAAKAGKHISAPGAAASPYRSSRGSARDPASLAAATDPLRAAASANLPQDAMSLSNEIAAVQRTLREMQGADGTLLHSNFMSSHEAVLLRWLTYHYNRAVEIIVRQFSPSPDSAATYAATIGLIDRPRRLVNFDQDIADPTVFLFVLISHLPDLARPGGPLDFAAGRVFVHAVSNAQRRANASALLGALRELQLEAPFVLDDFLGMRAVTDDDVPVLGRPMTTTSIAGTLGEEGGSIVSLRTLPLQGVGADAASVASAAPVAPPKPAAPLYEVAATASDAAIANMLPGTPGRCAVPTHAHTGTDAAASARNGLLWSIWLFQSLPSQVPKTTVDFSGALGSSITKVLTLTNPSKRPVAYTVSLEGAGEFSIATRSVKIEPESSTTFSVTCVPRFSKPVHAKLCFRSRREGVVAPATLVFALRSVVTSRPANAVKEVSVRCFSSSVIDVEVRNSFDGDAVFSIGMLQLDPSAPVGANMPHALQQALLASSPSPYMSQLAPPFTAYPKIAAPGLLPGFRAGSPRSPRPPATVTTGSSLDSATASTMSAASSSVAAYSMSERPSLIAPFFVKVRDVTLKAGQLKRVPVQYSPFTTGKHRAVMVLMDREGCVGELVYELTGRSDPPLPLAKLATRVMLTADGASPMDASASTPRASAGGKDGAPGGPILRFLAIPPINAPREAALDTTVERVERRFRTAELRMREAERIADVRARERALLELPRLSEVEHRQRTTSSKRGGGVPKGPDGAPASAAGARAAAIDSIGTWYTVSIDSPLFEAPQRVFVPGPLQAVTPAQLVLSLASHVPGLMSNVASPSATRPVTSIAQADGTAAGSTSAASALPARATTVFSAPASSAASSAPHPGTEVEGLIAANLEAPKDATALADTLTALVGAVAGIGGGTGGKPVTLSPATVMDVGTTPASVADLIVACPGGASFRALSKLPLVLRPRGPGIYSCRVTLTSDMPSNADARLAAGSTSLASVAPDVRVYDVEISVESLQPVPTVQFTAVAGQAITQQLPIVNDTDGEWVLDVAHAPLSVKPPAARADTPHHFFVPQRIRVAPNSTAHLLVAFSPEWISEERVRLTLRHNEAEERGSSGKLSGATVDRAALPASRQARSRKDLVGTIDIARLSGPALPALPDIVFELVGVSTEPPALDTVIVATPARVPASREVTVYNFNPRGPATFAVQCDVPFFAGEPTITVPAASVSQQLSAVGASTGAPGSSRRSSRVSAAGQLVAPGTATFSFTFDPVHSGVYAGTLTFTLQRAGGAVEPGAEAPFQWYALECTGLPAAPIARISLSTQVRKAVSVELELSNPTTEPLELDVTLDGEGLVGEPTANVPPGGTAVYEVLYAPLVPTPAWDAQPQPQPQDGAVRFFSEAVGELSYALDLVAMPAPKHVLPAMRAPVGGSAAMPFTLENPTPNQAYVTVHLDNSREFRVETPALDAEVAEGRVDAVTLSNAGRRRSSVGQSGSGILLPPFSTRSVAVVYTPSALDEVQRACITFSGGPIGTWEVLAEGTGGPPERAPETRVTATAGTTSSASITFRNPFARAVRVTPSLEVDGTAVAAAASSFISPFATIRQAFSATTAPGGVSPRALRGEAKIREVLPLLSLLKKKDFVVPAFGSVQVPFAFSPQLISDVGAVLRLHGTEVELGEDFSMPPGDDSLMWEFPLRCIGEAAVARKTIVITGKARERSSVALSLPLSGLATAGPTPDAPQVPEALDFVVSVEAPPSTATSDATDEEEQRAREYAASVCEVIARRTSLMSADETVDVELIVLANKPVDARLELAVTSRVGGGRWRFPLHVRVEPPLPDATLMVEAALGTTGSTSFTLRNAASGPAPYRAYLTLDTPPEFRVSPTRGVLQGGGVASPAYARTANAQRQDAALGPESSLPDAIIAVSFSPRDYGRPYAGQLIVETVDYMWIFNIKGTLPAYRPPASEKDRNALALDAAGSGAAGSRTPGGRTRGVMSAAGGTSRVATASGGTGTGTAAGATTPGLLTRKLGATGASAGTRRR